MWLMDICSDTSELTPQPHYSLPVWISKCPIVSCRVPTMLLLLLRQWNSPLFTSWRPGSSHCSCALTAKGDHTPAQHHHHHRSTELRLMTEFIFSCCKHSFATLTPPSGGRMLQQDCSRTCTGALQPHTHTPGLASLWGPTSTCCLHPHSPKMSPLC